MSSKLDEPHDRGDFFKSLGTLMAGFLAERVQEVIPLVERLRYFYRQNPLYEHPEDGVRMTLLTMEAMIADGWVTCEMDPSQPLFPFEIEPNADPMPTSFGVAVV